MQLGSFLWQFRVSGVGFNQVSFAVSVKRSRILANCRRLVFHRFCSTGFALALTLRLGGVFIPTVYHWDIQGFVMEMRSCQHRLVVQSL